MEQAFGQFYLSYRCLFFLNVKFKLAKILQHFSILILFMGALFITPFLGAIYVLRVIFMY